MRLSTWFAFFLFVPALAFRKAVKLAAKVYSSPPHGSFSLLKATNQPVKAHEKIPFQSLKDFYERCRRLSNLESEFMLSFWSDSLQCFQIIPNLNTNRVSVTTTCISLQTILHNPQHWKNSASWEPVGGKISLRNALNSLLKTPWSGDLYQAQNLVLTLAHFQACDKDDPKFVAALEHIIANRARLSLHRDQQVSTYSRYQNVRSLLAVLENHMIPTKLVGTDHISVALDRANIVAFDELCRQIAFFNSGDFAQFDVIVLAYNLLAYWDTSNSLFLKSFARGVIPTVNMKLVQSALRIIFSAQADDGTWRKGEPISKVNDPHRSRDIGNNYVFFFDLVASLLSSIGSKQPAVLAPYLSNLERCVEWAEINIQQEMLPEELDADTNLYKGTIVKGWRSNHLGDNGGAVAWCTAHVFQGLNELAKLARALLTESILAEFNGKMAPTSYISANQQEWKALMDSDLEINGEPTTLKQVLHTRLLLPQEQKDREINKLLLGSKEESAASPVTPMPPLYSLILFGPPGTAKTTICTSIANYLNYHFLTIDTACFLADGLEHIASRMTYVFNRLNSLERTVVLFDEIEEFCLDRENVNLGMESRLLTTAMLTQLNDLRRKQSCIFIVATNRLRSFDAAVIRPGRFDMLLFVGTPNLAARLSRLNSKLQSKGVGDDERARVVDMLGAYMKKNWEEVRFLSFAENESLLNTILEAVVRGTLLPQVIETKVHALLKTATIQGPVKAEYVTSESLSRLS
eukprot:gene33266-40246_t